MSKKFKKAVIVINISKEESNSLAQLIKKLLEEKDISTELVNFDGFTENICFKDYDFVVTLGGDGTVLYAARNCVEYDVPIFPVNFGQFGFMASVQKEEWKECLEAFLDDKAAFQYRSMLKAELYRDSRLIVTELGLNDVVISAKNTARTVALDIDYNDIHLCKLKSDGVIISTSTGSTAYSASAGGPIIDPELDAFVMTPINSFSLSSRPIVLNSNGRVSISIQPCRTKEICMIVDGQEPVALQENDLIKISTIDKKIKLIFCTKEKFYKALRSKLNWTGGPHA